MSYILVNEYGIPNFSFLQAMIELIEDSFINERTTMYLPSGSK